LSEEIAWLASKKAELFLVQQGYTTLPIDPFQIAKDLSIEVKAKPATAPGVSGMLLRHGDNFGILYATCYANEGFEKFSVAHELGHYLLEGHIDHVLPEDGIHESRAGFLSSDPYEMEADRFAAALLMPADLFKRACTRLSDGLDAIETMASLCNASMTTTAIRFAQLAPTCMAIVMSSGTTIDYCFMSESLKTMGGVEWLRKNEPIPNGVETGRFNANSGNVEQAHRVVRDVDLQDWFGGQRSLPGTEEILGLGRYGRTLTVLTTDVLSDDEDEDEELEESWEIRFRR